MTIDTKILLRIFLIIALISASQAIYCQSNQGENIFSPENRLKFGNYLYKEKDYLRALPELKEYLKTKTDDTTQFRFADCFFRLNRFSEAEYNFRTLFSSPTLADESRLKFFESLFFDNDYAALREYSERNSYSDFKYSNEVNRLKYISFFFDDSILPKENEMLNAFPDSVRPQILNYYLLKKFPPAKSVATAAILSAIIPGAGKIYTGEIGDGITAFAATALSAYLAYSNFHNDHQFRGWLFTGLTAFFYGGNIYGSAASAQIYNVRMKFDFQKSVKLFFEERNYFLPEINF